jgi:hypothetical protein
VGAARDKVLAVIAEELAPLVGVNMAQAALRLHCEKLGLSSAELGAPQVDSLLASLAPGLHVFIGKRKTDEAIAKIRATLARPAPVLPPPPERRRSTP